MGTTRTERLVEGARNAPVSLAVGLLGLVDDAGLGGLSPAGVLDVLAGWERVIGAVAVEQARAVRALVARVTAERGRRRGALLLDEEIVEELALALRVSPVAAGAMVGFAEGLGLLPGVEAALGSGSLGLGHARVLVDVLTGVDPLLDEAVRARLERQLVEYATTHPVTPAQLRRRAQRLILAADPDGGARRRRRARRRRYVSCRPDSHGMAWFTAYLPAPDAHACFEALDRQARAEVGTDPDDDRSLGARRADTLVDRLLGAQPTGYAPGDSPAGSPAAVRRDVRIEVSVPISVLTGDCDAPAELGGHGPIDAHLARELAFSPDATWRRLLTDPISGTVLDVGTTRYRPPAGLDRFVRLRDRTCRWPGCTVTAARCDLDHTVPFPDGPTSEDNLVALCRRHHRLKTLAGYTTEQHGDGRWQVTTPTGRVIATEPPSAQPEPPDDD